MSIVKVIDIVSEGVSLEAAVKAGIEKASQSVENIRHINVDYIEGIVEKNKITKFRINSKVSFIPD